MKNVNTKIESLNDSKIKINVTIDWDKVKEFQKEAFNRLKKTIKIDGFREGHATDAAIISKVGEMGILQETSKLVIDDIFPQIISEEKIKMIGHPSISVTKLSPNNPMEFIAEVSIYPDVKLPDYKKIASTVKKDTPEVTEEDYKKVEENVLAMHNRAPAPHNHKEGETCDHSEEDLKKMESEKPEPAKELTDDIVSKLGPFKTVAEFKERIMSDLKKEKEFESISNHRNAIAEAILKETDFKIPEILIDSEVEKIIAQMKDDVQKMGMSYEDYLKNSGKKEEEIKKEVRPEAEKRAKVEIILKEIAQKENIKPDENEAAKQIETISQMHSNIDKNTIKLYVENVLINEAVMQFLEK